MSMSRNIPERFRDTHGDTPEVPVLQCRRCGQKISMPDTGREPQYCGATCRRAGNRLRRAKGPWWWAEQPWYPDWFAEKQRKREESERKRVEEERKREERRKLEESMPPDVRKAYEEKRRAEFRQSMRKMAEWTIAFEVEALNDKHADVLQPAGKVIRLMDGSRTVEKLLWAAVQAENEHEADALFAKARKLTADGLTAKDMPDMDERDLVQHVVRTFDTDGGGS